MLLCYNSPIFVCVDLSVSKQISLSPYNVVEFLRLLSRYASHNTFIGNPCKSQHCLLQIDDRINDPWYVIITSCKKTQTWCGTVEHQSHTWSSHVVTVMFIPQQTTLHWTKSIQLNRQTLDLIVSFQKLSLFCSDCNYSLWFFRRLQIPLNLLFAPLVITTTIS